MDIHPPHAIRSFKDFLLQLLVITVGILIALSLEGLLEAVHHRSLRNEARNNLMAEIHENQRELTKVLRDAQGSQEQLEAILSAIHDMQAHRRPAVRSLALNWSVSPLHSTSWLTARTTGATSQMDYGEVMRYTRLYDLQGQYGAVQDRAFQTSLQVDALAPLAERAMKGQLTATQLEDAERVVGLALAELVAEREIATALQREYASF